MNEDKLDLVIAEIRKIGGKAADSLAYPEAFRGSMSMIHEDLLELGAREIALIYVAVNGAYSAGSRAGYRRRVAA